MPKMPIKQPGGPPGAGGMPHNGVGGPNKPSNPNPKKPGHYPG